MVVGPDVHDPVRDRLRRVHDVAGGGGPERGARLGTAGTAGRPGRVDAYILWSSDLTYTTPFVTAGDEYTA